MKQPMKEGKRMSVNAMRFEIRQQVWWASFESDTDYVMCPECGGTKFIRCILFDGTELAVDCQGCSRGYDGPQGVLRVYKRKPKAVLSEVVGVEMRDGKTEWQLDTTYRAADSDVFLSQDDAQAAADAKAAAEDARERDRINHKEKDTRSWSWHVHYHRDCIRKAEKDIAYHSAKLAVARVKAKEPATSIPA